MQQSIEPTMSYRVRAALRLLADRAENASFMRDGFGLPGKGALRRDGIAFSRFSAFFTPADLYADGFAGSAALPTRDVANVLPFSPIPVPPTGLIQNAPAQMARGKPRRPTKALVTITVYCVQPFLKIACFTASSMTRSGTYNSEARPSMLLFFHPLRKKITF